MTSALLERIDAGRPADTTGNGLAPYRAATDHSATGQSAALQGQWPGRAGDPDLDGATQPLLAPFIEQTRLAAMLADLYTDFGASSFTAQWEHDPDGLLRAALQLLDDLALIRRQPGGALILPAAARYRNITAALPEGARRAGQAAFDFFGAPEGAP